MSFAGLRTLLAMEIVKSSFLLPTTDNCSRSCMFHILMIHAVYVMLSYHCLTWPAAKKLGG